MSSTTEIISREEKKHLYSLDFLRGFAALSVCCLHFTFGMLPNLRDTPLTPLFSWGYLGVDIFFIISGFIIPYSLDRSGYQPQEFFRFIIKRIIRIGPPSYLMLALIITQRLIIDYLIKHDRTYTSDLNIYLIINNILYTVPYTSAHWLVGVLWTLAVEFQFYVLIGLGIGVLRRGIKPLILFAILVNAVKFSPYLHNVQLFEYNTVFILGMLLWLRAANRVSDLEFYIATVITLALVYVEINWLVAIFSTVTVLVILFFNKRVGVFAFLGNISYSIYLLHTVVGTTTEAIWIRLFPVQTLPQKTVLLLVCVLATVLASYFFYHFVEQPCMQFANKLFKPKALAPIPSR